jgi:phytoene dehydrogenase-like protein
MSASGIIGTFLGVRSPGTAYVLLHHYMGEIDGAFRSVGPVARRHRRDLQRDGDAAREAGVEIRTETPVSRILVKDGAAVGVVLENGDYYTADVVRRASTRGRPSRSSWARTTCRRSSSRTSGATSTADRRAR